ncbi:DUF473 domain-containing protein [Methanoplanus endosymbiosus]|uniref:DUF473 domain-containing protein n=1 Tax=Methanoplanus endosymbiosus TaxID=33865 RepID=A0A9E7PSC6_9EURY|nr:DUF473 domain-containing protein [Methanoplanus endosymbiosus]UUX92797.1 DUF473 domain-containing protein [Methanoplanus endosymbiosus]
MIISALTGISPNIITELKKGKPRTLELYSAHNIITLTDILPGDHIFMTDVDLDDVCTGDRGIIAEVQSINITMKRMTEWINPLFCEEKERMSARIKLKYIDVALAKRVEGREWAKPTSVCLYESSVYHAG